VAVFDQSNTTDPSLNSETESLQPRTLKTRQFRRKDKIYKELEWQKSSIFQGNSFQLEAEQLIVLFFQYKKPFYNIPPS
jgi:hypothetical protein